MGEVRQRTVHSDALVPRTLHARHQVTVCKYVSVVSSTCCTNLRRMDVLEISFGTRQHATREPEERKRLAKAHLGLRARAADLFGLFGGFCLAHERNVVTPSHLAATWLAPKAQTRAL